MRELNENEIKVVNGGMSQYEWESYAAAAAAEYYRNYFANYMPWGSSGGNSRI